MEKDIKKQLEMINMGTEDILVRDELEDIIEGSIKDKNPLKVKLGLDPTAPDIHLGHTVVLNKLRTFQDLGHKAILIIGDYTARIGDPSGRSALRPKLSPDTIDRNAETYMKQAFKILDPDRTELVRNSRWLKPLNFEDILGLTSRFTVARMLERDDFKKRFKGNVPIAIMEFLYPIMQAYDSVAIEADIELGGTDQRFNLLMGRELQKDMGQRPQIAITMPILAGTDGREKMSKSLGNYIGVDESPSEIFGKIMSIPDEAMLDYFRLLTRLDSVEIENIGRDMERGSLNPSLAKRRLAGIIIGYLHNAGEAEQAEKGFDRVFKAREVPDDIEESVINSSDYEDGRIWAARILTDSGLAGSNAEARRLIKQGAVRIDSKKIEDDSLELEIKDLNGKIIQKGKRHFRRIIIE
jgi:tyrosyl-tRNA synthetase